MGSLGNANLTQHSGQIWGVGCGRNPNCGKLMTAISQQRRLILKNRKRHTPPNLPCRVQLRTQKIERSSSIISRQRRLVFKNRKRRTHPNLTCRVQLRTQKMERSSSIISRQRRLISKNRKRHTPTNLSC